MPPRDEFFSAVTAECTHFGHMFAAAFAWRDERGRAELESHYHAALRMLLDKLPQQQSEVLYAAYAREEDRQVRIFVILLSLCLCGDAVLRFAEQDHPDTRLPRELAPRAYRQWVASVKQAVEPFVFCQQQLSDKGKGIILGPGKCYVTLSEYVSDVCSRSGFVPPRLCAADELNDLSNVVDDLIFDYISIVCPLYADPLPEPGSGTLFAGRILDRELIHRCAVRLASERGTDVQAHEVAAVLLRQHRDWLLANLEGGQRG